MIKGELVNLRAPEMSDLERNHRWINDREVTRFLGGDVRYLMTLTGEEAWMAGVCGSPMSFDRAFFAIETKDGRHIGNTNLFNVSPEDRRAELGIMIGDKEYWSRGCGRDAVRTLIRFGFEDMNLNRIALVAFAFNERAIACYRKAGFTEEGRLRSAFYQDGEYHDEVRMAVLREEYFETEAAR